MAQLIAMEKRIAMLQAIAERVFGVLHIGEPTTHDHVAQPPVADGDPARDPEPDLCCTVSRPDDQPAPVKSA